MPRSNPASRLLPALLGAALLAAAPGWAAQPTAQPGPSGPAAAGGDTVTFHLIDQLGIGEVEEATAVYINDTLVGSFHLDDGVQFQAVSVTVPRADSYSYAMCGHVTTRDEDGQVVDHNVNTSGTLRDVDGRVFEAVTDNFERYFMRDRSTARPPIPLETNKGQACSPAVS